MEDVKFVAKVIIVGMIILDTYRISKIYNKLDCYMMRQESIERLLFFLPF